MNSIKRHICCIKNLWLGHYLPTSENNQVISPFYFHETSYLVKIKTPQKLLNLQYIWFDILSMWWFIVDFKRSQVRLSKLIAIICTSFTEDPFLAWQTVETQMKCCILQHFICVSTVSKTTRLRVSSIQRVHKLSYLQKRTPEAKLSFDPPEVFVTEEYLIPPTNSQSEARKQDTVTEQSATSTEDRKDDADT